MFSDAQTLPDARSFRRPAIEGGIVFVAITTAVLLGTEPLFAIYLLPALMLVVAVVRFDAFVYTSVFFLPWYPLPTIDLPMRDVFLVLRFVMLAGAIISSYRDGRPFWKPLWQSNINKLVLLYAMAATVSLFVSPLHLKLDAFRSLSRLFSYLAVFFALRIWIQRREQIYQLIRILLISTIVVALFGLYQALLGDYTRFYLFLFEAEIPDWSGRVTSFLFHFNALAAYLNMIIPFAIAFMIVPKDRTSRLLGSTCFCLATAALYLTGSRGGLLAYFGILALSAIFLGIRWRPRVVVLLRVGLVLVVASAIVVLLTPKVPEQQQINRLQEVDDFTELSRLALWATAAEMFTLHPVFGVGYGNYRALYGDYLTDVESDQMDAHNLYLELLAETGILGFALFLLPVSLVLSRALILLRSADWFHVLFALGIGGGLTGMLVHGFVDFFFHVQPQVGGLFWLLMALGLVVWEDAKRIHPLQSLAMENQRSVLL